MEHQNPGLVQINLIMREVVPAQEPNVLFRNVSLTDSFAGYTTSSSPSPLSLTSSSSESVISAFVPLASVRKPCLFSSLLNWSSNSAEIDIEASPFALESEASLSFGIRLRSLPTTMCLTHGHLGYLPLEYVRVLPEYTCTTHYLGQSIVQAHDFEDCKFMFPFQNASSRPLQQLVRGNSRNSNTCNQCCKSLAGLAMYMYRDNPYCSHYCRYAAHVAHCLYDRTMKNG